MGSRNLPYLSLKFPLLRLQLIFYLLGAVGGRLVPGHLSFKSVNLEEAGEGREGESSHEQR